MSLLLEDEPGEGKKRGGVEGKRRELVNISKYLYSELFILV